MSAPSDAPALPRPEDAGRALRTARAIGMVVFAILLFTVMDTLAKSLSARYPVSQVIWARYFFQLGWMLLLVPRIGVTGLVRTTRLGMNIARGLLLAVSTICMITAISMIPLANATRSPSSRRS
jgi:drug/metabolite transporter (DMT)-like permease